MDYGNNYFIPVTPSPTPAGIGFASVQGDTVPTTPEQSTAPASVT